MLVAHTAKHRRGHHYTTSRRRCVSRTSVTTPVNIAAARWPTSARTSRRTRLGRMSSLTTWLLHVRDGMRGFFVRRSVISARWMLWVVAPCVVRRRPLHDGELSILLGRPSPPAPGDRPIGRWRGGDHRRCVGMRGVVAGADGRRSVPRSVLARRGVRADSRPGRSDRVALPRERGWLGVHTAVRLALARQRRADEGLSDRAVRRDVPPDGWVAAVRPAVARRGARQPGGVPPVRGRARVGANPAETSVAVASPRNHLPGSGHQ